MLHKNSKEPLIPNQSFYRIYNKEVFICCLNLLLYYVLILMQVNENSNNK